MKVASVHIGLLQLPHRGFVPAVGRESRVEV